MLRVMSAKGSGHQGGPLSRVPLMRRGSDGNGAEPVTSTGSAVDTPVDTPQSKRSRYLWGRCWTLRAGRLKLLSPAQIKLVAALRQYSDLARMQYDGGYTSYSTVLQAEQALFPAELALASLRAQVYASAVNLYKAMGGGWVGQADQITGGTPAAPPASAVPPPLF